MLAGYCAHHPGTLSYNIDSQLLNPFVPKRADEASWGDECITSEDRILSTNQTYQHHPYNDRIQPCKVG